MKKIVFFAAFFFALIISLCSCRYLENIIQQPGSTPAAATDVTTTEPTTVPTTAETTTEEPTTLKEYDFSGLKYTGNTAAACYDLKEDRYLYQKNIQTSLCPASLTKIVSSCVALEYLDPASVFVIGNEINFVGKDSSLCFIQNGQAVTMHDILCGMLLASGNDAAYTLAVNVARAVSKQEMTDAEAVEYFSGMMNDFCEAKGMKNSHFVNPEGWDNDNEYTTVEDLVTAVKYAMSFDVFREIVSLPVYNAVFETGQTVQWKNSNLMLDSTSPYYLQGICGVKTGTTPYAGRCLAAVYKDDAHELLVISMGNDTDDSRYYSVKEMIDTVLKQ